MTKDELRSLRKGDRVRWVAAGGECDGEVVEKFRGVAHIVWADGKGGTMRLNWRASFDRQRAKNIVLVAKKEGP